MIYVALLRGINVGGKNTVSMATLKTTFESLGFTDVKTYINSGNVIFSTSSSKDLDAAIEAAIQRDFNLTIPVIIRSLDQIKQLVAKIPTAWTNDQVMRTDVLFLWEEVNTKDAINNIVHNPDLEDLLYVPGALVWRIDRAHVRQGSLPKIIGTDFYKKLTIRNVNTTRKLLDLMQAI